MDPVVLVHLSDIHFTARGDSEAYRHESTRVDLVNDLARMRSTVGDASAVVVTGDIAFSGAVKEYEAAGEWLDEVAAAVSAAPAKILTVPGNHDVDYAIVGKSAELAHESLRTCPSDDLDRRLQELLDDPASPLLDKLKNYSDFATRYWCEIAADGSPWETDIPLPGGYTLAIVGMCSVFNSDRGDRQRLLLGKRQTTLMARPGKVYLLLAHHGPGDLRDGDAVRDKINGRAAALLTGHRHAQRVHDVDGCVEITAGAVNPEEETGWHPSYNWIRIGVDESGNEPHVVIELWHRQWRPNWNEFGSASRDGHVETFRSRIRAHAALPSGAVPTLPTAAGPIGTAAVATTPPAPVQAAWVAAPPAAQLGARGEQPDERPPLQDADGTAPDERNVRLDLFRLKASVMYAVLAKTGLLDDDDDWKKDYVSVITGAVETASERGELDRLDAAVRRAKAGGA